MPHSPVEAAPARSPPQQPRARGHHGAYLEVPFLGPTLGSAPRQRGHMQTGSLPPCCVPRGHGWPCAGHCPQQCLEAGGHERTYRSVAHLPFLLRSALTVT